MDDQPESVSVRFVSEVVGKEWYRLIVLQKKNRAMVYGSAGGWMILAIG